MPVPVPVSVKVPAALDVVSPGGAGLRTSAQVQPLGHGSAGAGGVSVVVTGLPADRLLNEAVPVLAAEPDATARPARMVADRRYRLTADSGNPESLSPPHSAIVNKS